MTTSHYTGMASVDTSQMMTHSKTSNPDGELDMLSPLFFVDANRQEEEFCKLLKAKEITTNAEIYTLGTYSAYDLTSVFSDQAELFLPQLTMIQTLADYIKTNVLKFWLTPKPRGLNSHGSRLKIAVLPRLSLLFM